MKKCFHSHKFKRHNAAKSRKAMRVLTKQHNHRTRFVRIEQNERLKKHSTKRKTRKTSNLAAPRQFSIINNPEEVFNYFNRAEHELKKQKGVRFDISEINYLTVDTITLLIAKIKDSRFNHKMPISGNIPKNLNLQRIIAQCHFLDHVITNIPRPSTPNKLIHKETANKVEPDVAKDACLLGLKHINENSIDILCESLYDILVEVMQNTNNHAGKERGLYDWWLLVYDDISEKKTCFCFLDLGVGIFRSEPVLDYKDKFLKFVGLKDNVDLLPDLFAGKIKSRTSRPERGKGIPQIYECGQDPMFNKFYLITNDVYADIKTHQYRKMSTNFEGTLFYWEINNQE